MNTWGNVHGAVGPCPAISVFICVSVANVLIESPVRKRAWQDYSLRPFCARFLLAAHGWTLELFEAYIREIPQ
jgi:hypothetical protein